MLDRLLTEDLYTRAPVHISQRHQKAGLCRKGKATSSPAETAPESGPRVGQGRTQDSTLPLRPWGGTAESSWAYTPAPPPSSPQLLSGPDHTHPQHAAVCAPPRPPSSSPPPVKRSSRLSHLLLVTNPCGLPGMKPSAPRTISCLKGSFQHRRREPGPTLSCERACRPEATGGQSPRSGFQASARPVSWGRWGLPGLGAGQNLPEPPAATRRAPFWWDTRVFDDSICTVFLYVNTAAAQ